MPFCLRRCALAIIAAAFWVFSVAHALVPNDILLMVNGDSMRSIEVASHYINARKIPLSHVCRVSLPPQVLGGASEISYQDYLEHVWTPAWHFIVENDLTNEIKAWVYSVDFPITVNAPSGPDMSLMGATLIGERRPAAEVVKKGSYKSPYYAGPDPPRGVLNESRIASQYSDRSVKRGLPSMMLGFVGSRGSTVTEVKDCIDRGVQSDSTFPGGTIYFVTNSGVRSLVRSWQYEAVAQRLNAAGVRAVISDDLPRRDGIVGILSGQMYLKTSQLGHMRPGAVADHFTSFGAVFDTIEQSKITQWIRAGATASAGTITEPYAVWQKFPSAFFFLHYIKGCSVLESFYQSVRCPLQLLMIGDPLARPWGQRLMLSILPLDDELFTLDCMNPPRGEMEIDIYLDGHRQADISDIPFTLTGLREGYHELQAVAYCAKVPVDGVARYSFITDHNEAVGVEIISPDVDRVCDIRNPLSVELRVDGTPDAVSFLCNGQTCVSEKRASGSYLVQCPKDFMGAVTLQARAEYGGYGAVLSRPVRVFFKAGPLLPDCAATNCLRANGDKDVCVNVCNAGPVRVQAYSLVRFTEKESLEGTLAERKDGGVDLIPDSKTVCGLLVKPTKSNIDCVSGVFSLSPGRSCRLNRTAGLVFNYQDANNFYFWGLLEDSSAWTLAQYRKGQFKVLQDYGMKIVPSEWMQIEVRRASNNTLEAWADGVCRVKWPDGSYDSLGGQVGFFVKDGPVAIQQVAVSSTTNLIVSAGGSDCVEVPICSGDTAFLRIADDYNVVWTNLFISPAKGD